MKKHSTAKPIPCFKRWSRTNYAVFASLHRQVTIGVLAVGMSILLLTTETAAAQQADTSGVSRVMRIEPIGVTGTRLSPSRSIQSQTPVFDRGTEAAAPFQTLEDALRLSPSIDIRERSGKGVQADISIRGGSPDQTMMLLNGINFTDARTGHQTHSLPIDMDCVSGIELIEGIPGVGAYAGAVNVRTVPLYRNYLRLKAEGGQHGYGYTNLSGALTRDPSRALRRRIAASQRRIYPQYRLPQRERVPPYDIRFAESRILRLSDWRTGPALRVQRILCRLQSGSVRTDRHGARFVAMDQGVGAFPNLRRCKLPQEFRPL